MEKINGIKSVDMIIKASGYGVVNYNGSTKVSGEDGKELSNHMMPKLRGYTNETGKVKEENGYKYKKRATEIDFKDNPMYISQNCIRHHLFKNQSNDLHFVGKKDSNKDPKKMLISISGLLRGYVIPKTQCKRKSPLLIEDFVDQLGNGNFEQFGNSGEKDSNSIFSKTTFGDTSYLAKASISIEDLQFISLDQKFDRAALIISNKEEGELLAKEITTFLNDFSFDNEELPKAEFGEYVRLGTIYEEPEIGILLNQSAIKILVSLMIDLIKDLSINQAKGWMSIDSVELDYNDSNKMMRIIKNPNEVEEDLINDFAIYYKKV